MKLNLKMFMLGFLVGMVMIGCTALFKRTDPMVEKGKIAYLKYTQKVDPIIPLLATIDKAATKLKTVYWDSTADTFTPAFNTLNDTNQVNLIAINDLYDKIKPKVVNVLASYKEFKNNAEKGYYDYYKIKKKSLAAESIIKKIPSIAVKLIAF